MKGEFMQSSGIGDALGSDVGQAIMTGLGVVTMLIPGGAGLSLLLQQLC
jgi:hypothetical protein